MSIKSARIDALAGVGRPPSMNPSSEWANEGATKMEPKDYVSVDRSKSFATQLVERVQPQESLLWGAGPDLLYRGLRRRLRKVKIDEVDLYIVEGDSLLDEDQLWLYSLHLERLEREEQNRNLLRLVFRTSSYSRKRVEQLSYEFRRGHSFAGLAENLVLPHLQP